MSARERLNAAAGTRILLTDGAFGTEIQNWKLREADYAGALGLSRDQKGNNDILALSMPEVPEAITRAYLEAGSDIVSTNTFSANAIRRSAMTRPLPPASRRRWMRSSITPESALSRSSASSARPTRRCSAST